ncbi:MAG: glycosyltransferase family 4 protein [Actinomycetota bacterium]|nr:glycosyltransferase family 4 protein [Actinomycetota bacterium]
MSGASRDADAAEVGGTPIDPAPTRLRLGAYLDSPAVGGSEISLARTLGSLPEWVDVTVVGTSAEVVRWVSAGIDRGRSVLLSPVRSKWDVVEVARHISTIHDLRLDVLHANLWHPWAGHYGLLAARACRVPTVIAVHADLEASTARTRLISRWFYRRASAVVAVSNQLARITERQVGLPPGTIGTIYNAVESPPRYVPYSASSHRPVRVGAVGRLSFEKGFDVLLTALGDLPDVRLSIVGDGPERGNLGALVSRYGMTERVTFEGWVENVWGAMAEMDIVVAPSRREGFGLAVAEAMMAGIPVVATRVGGLPEVVDEGTTAFLVDPGDAVGLARAVGILAGDPELRQKMGRAGRRRAIQFFSPEGNAANFADLYRRVAVQRSPVPEVSSG